MNPSKVDRNSLHDLTDLPNIGKSLAEDLRKIGIQQADDLVGQDPFAMHASLCQATGTQHDPCVIDVFISITRFMDGAAPLPWWKYTAERKQRLLAIKEIENSKT